MKFTPKEFKGIDVNIALPIKNMKVEWLCEDGIKDVGFFYKNTETFASIDLRSKIGITHWKPLSGLQPQPQVNEDELWNEVGAILNNGAVSFSMYPKYLEELKSRFSITRK